MEIDKRPDENSRRAFSGTWAVALGSENKNQMPWKGASWSLGWGKVRGRWVGLAGGGLQWFVYPLRVQAPAFSPSTSEMAVVCGLFSSLLFIFDPACACMRLFLSPL